MINCRAQWLASTPSANGKHRLSTGDTCAACKCPPRASTAREITSPTRKHRATEPLKVATGEC
ncbi:hypothetical protein D3C84_912070 [compost metagenome]